MNKNKDNIRSGTLSLTKSGKYFYSILIDRDNTKILKETNNIIGLDLGIKDFVVTSNNTKYDNKYLDYINLLAYGIYFIKYLIF